MKWFWSDRRVIKMTIADEHLTYLDETAILLGGGLDKVVAHSLSLYLALKKQQAAGFTELVLRNPQTKTEKVVKI